MRAATEELDGVDADPVAPEPAPPQPPEPKQVTKASFNLPVEELESLKRLAKRRQTTATQVVRQALATEMYIQNLVDEGAEVVAKDGRRGREIVFAHMLLG